MPRRIRQADRNLAKALFQNSQDTSGFAQQLLTGPVAPTPEQLREAEDATFDILLLLRQYRHMLTATVIHEKGQRA
jgi:hypothetical protein